MKKYDSYKDSGIEWLCEIPKHWEESKLKYLFSFGKGLTITKENLEDVGVPCVNYGEIHSHCGFKVNPEKNSLKCVSEDYLKSSKNSLLTKGDFVFADTSEDIEGSGNFTHLYGDRNVFAGYHTIILKPSQKLNSRFFAYHFDSLEFRSQIRSTVKGIKVLSVTQSILKNCEVWIPSFEEQTAIANFLDHKTTQIDDLIAKKERLIQLLEEERTAIINQAVTKGLDPNVPMKDSGIEWLGEIPEHWEVKKLAFEFQTLNTKRIPLSAEERGRMELREFDYYGASGVIDKVENYLFDEDLILIGEDGANLLTRSKRLVFIASGKYWVNNHAHIIKPVNGNINYYCELLELIDYTIYISGSAQPKLTQEALMSIKIPVPPVSEQNSIFEFLEDEFHTIDDIVSKTQQEIELLKEYKTALISEVVTGKVDVRNEKLN